MGGGGATTEESAVVSGVSGAGSGIIALLATYPLLTKTTRQQTATRARARAGRGGGGAEQDEVEDGGGEGGDGEGDALAAFASLYDGLLPALLGTTASQGVYYYFYALFKSRVEGALARRNVRAGAGAYLLVAALAGSVNVLLTNPIWLLVTRMQVQEQVRRRRAAARRRARAPGADAPAAGREGGPAAPGGEKAVGLAAAAREVMAESGLAGFWKGVLPSLIMVSNPAISYMLFEMLSKRQGADRRAAGSTVQGNFLNGAIAKLGATIITYPLQLIKSRMQAASRDDASLRYTGILHAVSCILQEDGFLGFYRGMRTKICQSVFAAALLFAVQDSLKGAIAAALRAPAPAARSASRA